MKKYNLMFLLFLIILVKEETVSQNLIPNGNFEYYTACPSGPAQVYRAFPWYDPNNANSDYYNLCAPESTGVNVPCQVSCIGYYQYAHSGNGYSGLQGAIFSNYRDYLQVQLISPLYNNKCYYVEFYTNLANDVAWGINNIGAYISNTAITSPAPNPFNLTPQILLPGNPVITDTLNWTKVYAVYQANGGEDYITIGNFQNDSNTVFVPVYTGSGHQSYYNIDDVSMYEIKTAIAGRDTIICHGDSVQLGIANYEGVTYQWQPTTGLSNAGIGNPYAKPLVTTTYYFTQTTPCATTIDTVTVTMGNCTIGINELEMKNDFLKLYPNPASTSITLESKMYKILNTNVYNVFGEVVNSIDKNTNNKNEINISKLSQGIYFIEVQTEKGIVRKKFIKSNQ